MLNSMIALKTLGYAADHPLYVKAKRDFEGLFVDDPEDFRIQPCLSPVWDTGHQRHSPSLRADCSPGARGAAARRALAGEQGSHAVRGDWQHKNHHRENSGWAFEFNNVYYPDTDDTMMVLMALRLVPDRQLQAEAGQEAPRKMFERALRWLISFQCRDGGWAAFDKDVMQGWLEDVPFADHNAILDPTCSDLTGRTLELLGYIGYDQQCRRVQRATRFIRETQESDGSWYGRWGVNYIYGTWQVLRGLRSIGWICASRGSCGRAIGWRAAKMKTAAGARPVPATMTHAEGQRPQHREPDRRGRSWASSPPRISRSPARSTVVPFRWGCSTS
jgi:squalene-hopene/tetraprenyl-beta-curcumene cyclase